MPYDKLGFHYPDRHPEVEYYQGSWGRVYYHVSKPDSYVEFQRGYAPWKPTLKQYIRMAVDKNLQGMKDERANKIGAWAKDTGIPIHLIKCQGSGAWFNSRNQIFVRGESGLNEPWEVNFATANTIICSYSQHRFSKATKRKFTEVVEYGLVLNEHLVNFFRWADGLWHASRENEHLALQEEAKKSGTIASYHSLKAPWRTTTDTKNRILFGVELELRSKNGSSGRRAICDEAEAQGFLGETDSSLCRESGIEVIAPPMEYDTITSPESPWRKFLAKVGSGCFDEQHNYGMHVSVSRAGMSTFHQVKFMLFFHKNKPLAVKVAERDSGYANFYPELKASKKILEGCRSAAGPNGKHRIEVRIFQSVATEKKFLRNVEFTAAAVDFSRQHSVKNLTEPVFLEWLKKGKRGQYPNLCNTLLGERKPSEDFVKGQKRLKLTVSK